MNLSSIGKKASLWKRQICFMLLLVFPVVSDAEQSTEVMAQTMCFSCHVTKGKPTIAPPMFAVKHHVMSAYPSEAEFVAYVAQWVKNPTVQSSLMPGAVRRFGLMPTLGYSDHDVRRVARYLYHEKFRKPIWFDEHFKKEHGENPK